MIPLRVPALALLLALGACTPSAEPDVRTERVVSLGCEAVDYADVRGPELGEPNGTLRDYPVADAVCDAWWLDLADDFVPQGLELDGRTAYVVGHRAGAVGHRLCQVATVDLGTGRTTAFTDALDPGDGSQLCRHGGGAALTDAGLWVIQTSRLWLLDPDRIGRPDQVRRVWELADEVRGSTIAAHDGQLVIAGYRPRGPGKARWYAEASVLAVGATDLVESSAGAGQVAMSRSTRVPPRLQGARVHALREAMARLVPNLVRADPRGRSATRLRARRRGLRGDPGLDLGGQRGQRFAVPRSGWGAGAPTAAPRPGCRARQRSGHLRVLRPACPAENRCARYLP